MTPAKFYVKQYKRAKYSRPEGNGVAIGKLPEFALPKAIAGSSVLNHLLVSKYVDHLPLHRQIKMFSRIGMTLSDSTINDWIMGSVNLLTALNDRQTHKLMQYAQDGILLIDNNLIENQIRPVAVGRKNYLFCGSHESAQRAAIIYSLLGTCKLNNVNPQDWLLDVLQKLPARKANNIDDLLPQNWNPKLQGVL